MPPRSTSCSRSCSATRAGEAAAGPLHVDAARHAQRRVVARAATGSSTGAPPRSICAARSLADGMLFGSGTTSCALPRLGHRLLDAGQRRLQPLADGEDAQLGALLDGQVLEGQAAEQVVDDRRGEAEVGIVGHAGRLEAHADERLHEARNGTPYCSP